MKLKRVRGIICDRVYSISEDTIELKRIFPHEDYILWRVEAKYDNRKKANSYYVLAKRKIDAKNKFLTNLPWLNIISSINQVDRCDYNEVLSKPFDYLIF